MFEYTSAKDSLPFSRRLAIGLCLVVGSFFALRAATPDATATPSLSTTRATELSLPDTPLEASRISGPVTACIEDVRLGQRVVGINPIRDEADAASDVDPQSWRVVRLQMRQAGTDYDLSFLRPVSWLEALGAKVGCLIPIQMHEMGLDGPARVIGVDPCPAIEPDDGTGRMIVTGTMSHPAGNILNIDVSGEEDSLGVTTTHPIWSEDRQDFVLAKDLHVGERLRTLTGASAVVTRITPHRGPPEMVYNLEVDGEHVYCVGNDGLLVHNNSAATVSRWGRAGLQAGDWVMKGGKNVVNYALSGKYQPGFGNQYASYSTGREYTVLTSQLQNPSGPLGLIKAWLGQRIYTGPPQP